MLEHDKVHLRRSKFLRNPTCFERIMVRSYADNPLTLTLELQFAADFADLFEVRGEKRPRRGTYHPPLPERDRVTLAYTGLDGRRRETRLRFDPVPSQISADKAVFTLTLAPGERKTIIVETHCGAEETARDGLPEPARSAFIRAFWECSRARRTLPGRATSIVTSDAVFNELIGRSVADLDLLTTQTPEGPYPYAGVPWFSTVFGRDALVTAWLMLWVDPAIALGVLRHLAAMQATTTDPAADAEPGKILHEVRNGEMAELGEVPFRRYYGSVDSTLLFVALAGAWLDRTGEVETLRPLWPNIEAALRWIEVYGDRDGDGFVEYGRMTETGLANQGWKDSWDSVSHADGSLAEGTVALCEVQAYAGGTHGLALFDHGSGSGGLGHDGRLLHHGHRLDGGDLGGLHLVDQAGNAGLTHGGEVGALLASAQVQTAQITTVQPVAVVEQPAVVAQAPAPAPVYRAMGTPTPR